jgi:NAD+ synthase (glutamine-hydrolysing)
MRSGLAALFAVNPDRVVAGEAIRAHPAEPGACGKRDNQGVPPGQDLLRVALAQINPTVGDIRGNARKIAERTSAARDQGAALVVFPELTLSGYPPEDLLLKTSFLDQVGTALEELATQTRGIVALVGFPESADDVYNSAAVLADGEVAAVYRKMYLPNYGVFDEQRYFQSGSEAGIFELNGIPIGVSICEDIWEPGPPAMTEALAGAQVIVNLSASPYRAGYGHARQRMLVQRAVDNLAAVVFVNTIGGQDELVFDGHSLAIDQDGRVLARCPQFEECLTLCTIDPREVASARLRDTRHRVNVRRQRRASPVAEPPAVHLASVEVPGGGDTVGGSVADLLEPEAEVYAALRTGLRDYVDKNGFERVVLALSGGIDSALVALVAADALGPERVSCVSMPSPFSSAGTRADARRIAENLGTDFMEIPIEEAMKAYDDMLAGPFAGREPDVAEENVQARIRGNLVMALSNKFGWLVLTTGNKSELSVGYATLYGDMAGGFAVLKDVFKGMVYRLVRWRNEQAGRELVPATVLERPPSAELRYEQTDQESLPPYDVLDAILAGYVEEDLDAVELVRRGLPREDVERVIRMVDRAEYKRRQAPPGIKISTKAFGRDRRLPITNRYERRDGDTPERRLRALG